VLLPELESGHSSRVMEIADAALSLAELLVVSPAELSEARIVKTTKGFSITGLSEEW